MRRKERTRRARCKKEKGAPKSHAFLRPAVRGTGFASLAPLPGRRDGEAESSDPDFSKRSDVGAFGTAKAVPYGCHPKRSEEAVLYACHPERSEAKSEDL